MKKMKKPFVVAISGIAGSGKDSVLERLWQMPQLFEVVVSYTDRPIRPGEIKNKNYHYISKQEFDEAIEKKEFIEWEKVRGEYRYGRKKADIETALKTGKTLVMSVDVLGMQKFKKIFDLATIFIVPPSAEEAIKRLQKRGSDTKEGLEDRVKRYSFELSFRDKYDHILINDKLPEAQTKLLEIIKGEKDKRQKKRKKFRVGLFSLLLVFALIGIWSPNTFAAFKNWFANLEARLTGQTTSQTADVQTEIDTASSASDEVKEKIAETPPETSSVSGIAKSTTKNSDGSTTTAVSTGGSISSSDLAILNSSTGTVSSPLDIPFTDETGKYSSMGGVLESYLNSVLRWTTDISAMKSIIIRNAGASGWNGQYLGTYTSSGGKIISVQGAIILNTYYIESQYCTASNYFTNCENEYAKLFLSHEYGHHYTLYHKWLDLNLGSGTRFPDSYYEVRPLTKTTTATDYSLGWANCEVEIIAEDYSYLYSGYGQYAMHATYGYPSSATKTWLNNLGSSASSLISSSTTESTTAATTANSAPSISISSPSSGATLSGTINFQATASDDVGIANVNFYVDDTQIASDTSSPYSTEINTTSYTNGSHVLKALAGDGSLTSSTTVTVVFDNETVDTTKPTVNITAPTENPYTLTSSQLTVSVVASDNDSVDKIELYTNDTLQKSWSASSLTLALSFRSVGPGTYTIKFRAYDKAGNYSDATLSVIKN